MSDTLHPIPEPSSPCAMTDEGYTSRKGGTECRFFVLNQQTKGWDTGKRISPRKTRLDLIEVAAGDTTACSTPC